MERLGEVLKGLNLDLGEMVANFGSPILESRDLRRVPSKFKDVYVDSAAVFSLNAMLMAALLDDLEIVPVSGFRDYDYQLNLIRSGLDRGMDIKEALSVWMPPGFSEHHSGLAIDFSTPSIDLVLEEYFDKTEEFGWLVKNADKFGFKMSYPKDNSMGIVYEPWHWKYSR